MARMKFANAAWLPLVSIGLLLLSFTGCQTAALFHNPGSRVPAVFEAQPDSGQLTAAIQKNTQSVRELKSSVKVNIDGLPASLNGTLLVERPSRLRLKCDVVGFDAVDIGSNENRFWFFNKSSLAGSQPAVFYADRAALAASDVQQSLQFRPEWLIDALGLIEFDPNEEINGPIAKNGNLELYTTLRSEFGTTHRKITVDSRTAAILQVAVYDGNNRLLGWANASKHQYFPEHGVSLPGFVEMTAISSSGQRLNLTVRIQGHTINASYVDPSITYSMPRPQDVPLIDLTRVDPLLLEQSLTLPSQPNLDRSGSNQNSPNRPFRLGRLRGFELNRRR